MNLESLIWTLFFYTNFLIFTSSGQDIVSRVNQLSTTVANDQQRIIQLENTLFNLENVLLSVQSDMVSMFRLLNEQVDRVSKKPKAAFYVRLQTSYTDIKPEETIKYTDVITNLGGAYDSYTGIFTAPFDGHYVFYAFTLGEMNASMYTALAVNGVKKMHVYSAGIYHAPGSNMALVHLRKGDRVNMMKDGGAGNKPHYLHHIWTSWTGFLLYPD